MTHYSADLYSKLTNSLRLEKSVKDAAEVHGVLCGILCSAQTDHYSLWEKEILQQSTPRLQAHAVFKELYAYTNEQIDSADFSFSLLLPDDDNPLKQRTDALGLWCQGFLFGLCVGGIIDLEVLSDEVREFTSDILKIAQINEYALQHAEQDETAYTELVEYVRAGVQLVKEELSETKIQPHSTKH